MPLGLTACDSGESGVTFADFRNAVEARAGTDAIECSSQIDPNQCIADAFDRATAAFSVFTGQGIDSQTGNGVAITNTSRVFFLDFDSDPSGGGSSSNGRISTRECVNPQPSSTGVGAFGCE